MVQEHSRHRVREPQARQLASDLGRLRAQTVPGQASLVGRERGPLARQLVEAAARHPAPPLDVTEQSIEQLTLVPAGLSPLGAEGRAT